MKKSARILLPFLVLLFVVMGCQVSEADVARLNAERDRKAVVADFNKRFYLPSADRCAVKFYTSHSESKTIFAEACSLMGKERVLIYGDILTVENTQKLKAVGFEVLEFEHQDGKKQRVPIE